MAMKSKLNIDELITIDDTGMPVPPTTRQLIDKDIRMLYSRDTSKDKHNYINDCIIIYYMGDPKSPAKQAGLNDAEALRMAIEQAGLPNDYIPDPLVRSLTKRYYEENITEAGRVVENMLKGLHNINLSISTIQNYLTGKLNTGISDADVITTILSLIDNVNKRASELPATLKKLEEAKNNLLYEQETQLSRGGNIVSSSMDAENYKL